MASARKCCALFMLLLVSGLCSAADYYNILDVNFGLALRHEQWAAEHGRVYKYEAERSQRFEVFKDNLKYIEEYNSEGVYSHTLGLNQFADLTHEEFRNTYGGRLWAPESELQEEGEGTRSVKYEVPNLSIPDSVDWRKKGAVGPVIHQGQCASCWAMAVTAAIEGLHQIYTGNFTSLSAQQLIDCDKDNNGCDGGYLNNAYKYVIRNRGITDAATYPFKHGTKEGCDKQKEKKAAALIDDFEFVGKTEEQLAEAVAQVVVSAAIDTKSRAFQFYKSGIFNGQCGLHTDHAIAVVGYGGSGSNKYWIVKNSWGKKWGEDGYIRLKRDSAYSWGKCGIASRGSYPKIE